MPILPETKKRLVSSHYLDLLGTILKKCKPEIENISANCTVDGCEAHVIYGEQKYKITVEPEND